MRYENEQELREWSDMIKPEGGEWEIYKSGSTFWAP